MKRIASCIAWILASWPVYSQCPSGIQRIAGNFAIDLSGPPDTRQGTEGTTADFAINKIQFVTIPNCSIRILRVVGDVVSWPSGQVPAGSVAGILWGLQTSKPDWCDIATPANGNTLLYVQDGTRGEVRRTPVDTVIDSGYLEPDGVLVSKMASWLNNTGRPIHMEATWVIYWKYEPQWLQKKQF